MPYPLNWNDGLSFQAVWNSCEEHYNALTISRQGAWNRPENQEHSIARNRDMIMLDPYQNVMKFKDDDDTSGDIINISSSTDMGNMTLHAHLMDNSMKLMLIKNRMPRLDFVFPARPYKDSHQKDGVINRYCQRRWLDMYDFAAYSQSRDGLYCLSCILFPNMASLGRPRALVSYAYRSWNNAKPDLRSHSYLPYHLKCYSNMMTFLSRMKN